MIRQLEYYQAKLLQAGDIDPAQMLLLAQDDQLLIRGCEALLPLGREILHKLDSTSLFIGQPFQPYLALLFHSLLPSMESVVPLDTETRTFLHDIPVIRAEMFRECGADIVVEKLRYRKGVLVEGVGLVATGGMTIEQGYVNFCSLLHATVVKVLLDLLREPLPDKQVLAQTANWCKTVCHPLPLDAEGLPPFDVHCTVEILQAMAEVGSRTVTLGLVDSFFGNISVAVEPAIYISQTGASLDRLSGCIDYVLNDDSSCVGLTASSELAAHRAIYAQTNAQSILHGHPRFSVILSLLCDEECKTDDCWKDCDRVRVLNGVPVVAGEVGAGGLARNIPPVIERCQMALVYGHGVFVIGGADFSRPLTAMLEFENWCRADYFRRLQLRISPNS